MEHSIILENTTKKYGDINALDNLSLTIKKSIIFGLLGPNGAGKTTTMRICSTLLKADEGKVIFDRGDSKNIKKGLRHSISYMPQGKALDALLNVEDNLKYYCKLIGLPSKESKASIEKVIILFGLEKFTKKNVFAISGGQFRRVQLARGFLGKPQYILLDEPTLGIDIQGKLSIWKTIREYVKENGCTVILASNDMTEIEQTCDEVGFINSGKLLYKSKLSDISIGDCIHLRCKLSNSFSSQSITIPERIKVKENGNYKISLHFERYNEEIFSFLNILHINCGIIGLTEERMSLTDLFEKYGKEQS